MRTSSWALVKTTGLPLPPVCLPVSIGGRFGGGGVGDGLCAATGTGAPAYHLPPAFGPGAPATTDGCGICCGLSGYHVPPLVVVAAGGRAGDAQRPAENTRAVHSARGLQRPSETTATTTRLQRYGRAPEIRKAPPTVAFEIARGPCGPTGFFTIGRLNGCFGLKEAVFSRYCYMWLYEL